MRIEQKTDLRILLLITTKVFAMLKVYALAMGDLRLLFFSFFLWIISIVTLIIPVRVSHYSPKLDLTGGHVDSIS